MAAFRRYGKRQEPRARHGGAACWRLHDSRGDGSPSRGFWKGEGRLAVKVDTVFVHSHRTVRGRNRNGQHQPPVPPPSPSWSFELEFHPSPFFPVSFSALHSCRSRQPHLFYQTLLASALFFLIQSSIISSTILKSFRTCMWPDHSAG